MAFQLKLQNNLPEKQLVSIDFVQYPKAGGWVDVARQQIILDTASQSRADEVTAQLLRALEGLTLAPLQTQISPAVAMSDWLNGADMPPAFELDRECELQATDDTRAKVRYTRHNLNIEEVRSHIAAGKMPTQVGVVGSAMTQPVGTITSVHHHSKVAVHLTRFRFGSVGSAMDEPLHTLTAGGEPARPSTGNVMGLVTASLIHMGHGEASKSGAPRWSDGTRDIEQPLNTVTASDMPAAVVTSNLVKLRGDNIGSAADEPLHTISAQGQHHAEVRAFLLQYYGNEHDGASCNDPMHTVRSKDCFGLVYIKGEAYEIADIGLRMLTPRELARAQGFPESYVLDCEIIRVGKGKTLFAKTTRLSKTAQVRMIGNSVCPEVAAAVVAANFTHEVHMMRLQAA